MKILNTIRSCKDFIRPVQHQGTKIAFVPTMGALHKGHISLISRAKKEAGIVVCSIFVNPTQFTDPKDLEKYPRPLQHDIAMLEQAGCDAVFMPSVKEMYPSFPEPEDWKIDLGPAEFLLEGTFRMGHYQGVTQIVKKLFDAIEPDIAFFGQKDFQQVLMIKNMVERLRLQVKIVSCPIIREDDGLAMSSRNIHLNKADRQNALILKKALDLAASDFHAGSAAAVKSATELIHGSEGVKLDYFTIADAETLQPYKDKSGRHAIALVAAKVGETRLIDNMLL